MLRRVVQMDAPRTRRAWAWFDLGRVLKWSRAPRHEIRAAFEQAVEIDPKEERFRDALDRLDENGHAG
jgi:ATP-dependent DNA helicase RecG